MDTNKKVLITGAHGFLGSTLMLRLQELGWEPVAFEGDVRDAESALKQCRAINPAWVIHAAAKIDVAWCEQNKEEAYAVNVDGTKSVVAAAQALGARVLFISTSGVFSGEAGNYTEGDVPTPQTFYGKTKVEGEQAVCAYTKGVVVRLILLGVHPKGAPGKNFFEWVKISAQQNKDLTLFNDQYTNSISNWSAADYIEKIMGRNGPEELFHIGTKDATSKYESALLILKHFPNYKGTVTPISVDNVGDGLFRPKHMVLNTEKAASLFGSMPTSKEEIETIFNKPPFVPVKQALTIVVICAYPHFKNGAWHTSGVDDPGDHAGSTFDRFRVLAAAELAKKYPDAKLILSGGAQTPDSPSCAEVARRELVELGVPNSRMIIEDRSKSVHQQLYEVGKLAKDSDLTHLLLVTNDWHHPRLKAMIEHAPKLEMWQDLSWEHIDAEKVMLESATPEWIKMVEAERAHPKFFERVAIEQEGTKDVEAGAYAYKPF